MTASSLKLTRISQTTLPSWLLLQRPSSAVLTTSPFPTGLSVSSLSCPVSPQSYSTLDYCFNPVLSHLFCLMFSIVCVLEVLTLDTVSLSSSPTHGSQLLSLTVTLPSRALLFWLFFAQPYLNFFRSLKLNITRTKDPFSPSAEIKQKDAMRSTHLHHSWFSHKIKRNSRPN